MHILYADDFAELHDLMRSALSTEGHELECVSDGRKALERITADPARYDVVITDHRMPHMTGVELVGHLRAADFRGKILILTGETRPQITDSYRRLQVDAILQKPLSLTKVRHALAHLKAPDAGAADESTGSIGNSTVR